LGLMIIIGQGLFELIGLGCFLFGYFSQIYVGVFWASAGLKVLGIPTALKKVFRPSDLLATAGS